MVFSNYQKFFSLRVVMIVVVVFVLFRHAKTTVDNFNKEGSFFPSVTLVGSKKEIVKFPIDDGRSWVGLFWSVHCGPCRVEMELIQKAINSGYIPSDRVYAIHIGGDSDSVGAHMTKHGFTFPFLVDPRGELSGLLGVALTPTSFLVEKDRKILWASSGLGVTHVFRMSNHLK
ncbi:MAG: hypothetical protein RJB13_860 [Pseudomonadota bacterium]|jgi:thiol-disulfide isomerase/thioredoxin